MTRKLALITGAGNGIGAAIATAAYGGGYRVAVMDANAEAARTMAAQLGDAIALPCDVTDEKAVDQALAALGATPDLLVNNAGIVKFGHLLDISVSDEAAYIHGQDLGVDGGLVHSLLSQIPRG